MSKKLLLACKRLYAAFNRFKFNSCINAVYIKHKKTAVRTQTGDLHKIKADKFRNTKHTKSEVNTVVHFSSQLTGRKHRCWARGCLGFTLLRPSLMIRYDVNMSISAQKYINDPSLAPVRMAVVHYDV